MKELKEYGMFLAIVAGICVTGLLILLLVMYLFFIPMYRADCENIHRYTGQETMYDSTSGCFIREDDGQFITKDKWEGKRD